ncbi:MAG: sigma-70 family RNA polymerase sigma factor [Planctomycetes bacterium]|nr:sigma-70 family RNA polymerase sigma factor [Planctomycetota bacterium]
MDPRTDVTRLLADWRAGDRTAAERLLPAVYEQLRREAARQMARERADHTLQPTGLVHEAWLDLARESRHDWNDRAHFLAVAGLAMRRVLVDHAQRRAALKRGANARKVGLDALEAAEPVPEPETDWIALDAALERLAALDPRKARVVELRFFAGIEHAEIARVLEVSERTVERDWRLARAWLRAALETEGAGGTQ